MVFRVVRVVVLPSLTDWQYHHNGQRQFSQKEGSQPDCGFVWMSDNLAAALFAGQKPDREGLGEFEELVAP